MTPAQVRAQIASGTTHPIYLLESDDAPSRYDLAQAFLAVVDEGLHAFNTAAFHAREAGNAGDRDQMLSAILGAALMVFADTLARTLAAPAEVPIGILTAVIGAPFFLAIVLRQRSAVGL